MKFRLLFILLLSFFVAGAATPSRAQDGGAPAEKQDAAKALEEKLAKIDLSNADQLFEVAVWATQQTDDKVRARGRSLLKEVLELDRDHEGAHQKLGHIKVDDAWFTSKSEADKALKEKRAKEMKEKGYVAHDGGWILPADKAKVGKGWKKDDDGIWRSEADIRGAKGEVLYQGEWLTMTPEDAKRMEKHKKLTGEDVLIVTTPHFVLHLSVPPKFMKQYSTLVEKIYAWFLKEFDVPADQNLWPQRAHIWSFLGVQQYQDWITAYSEEYKLSDEDKKHFRDHPGGWILSHKLLALNVNSTKKAEDLENSIAHNVGHFLLTWYCGGKDGAWLREAFANLVEMLHTTEKIGQVSCSTLSRYGGKGDVAEKEFNTKDCPSRCKAMVKADDDPPMEDVAKADLNALSGHHLSKGYSIIEMLYTKDHDKFIALINACRSTGLKNQGPDGAVQQMVEIVAAVFGGIDLTGFDDKWRDFVRKNYK